MLTLINTNRMLPPIGPIALDYIGESARQAGIDVEVVDLCLSDNPTKTLEDYFSAHSPTLVGITFRNTDDCFWPSARWFVPDLAETIKKIRGMTDAPIVIGGVGFSVFAERIVDYTGVDFGIRGDGEQAIVSLVKELRNSEHFENIGGLIWRRNDDIFSNKPSWPSPLSLPTSRNQIDNLTYFKKGGQCGFETKRGCDRGCIYCADHMSKGANVRLRKPSEIADEVDSLIAQGIEVLHTCDAEFNIPREHAYAVCEEFSRRSIGKKISWYTYLTVVPFDAELAAIMKKAGCVGINFTGDSASHQMLKTYGQPHKKEDLALAVRLCRENNIKVMIDLLLGGPGETSQTVKQTIDFIKHINPDCAGASIGIRIYPGTKMPAIIASEGPAETNPNILRKYSGPVDIFQPTFYISHALDSHPARLVKDLIAGDKRFFEPAEPETMEGGQKKDHNYNDNLELAKAIENGRRGAYWDILRKLRGD
ncbi:MAG: radical SAM protein [Sedimentisphaerales bacterium]|nr:radical SAM protein [Sedimentisphaerales bacterium]